MGAREVPEMEPGDIREFLFSLEMPLDPVRLRVELNPNPVDRDETNDFYERPFGSPAPEDFRCQSVHSSDEDDSIAVRLTWTNPVAYDQVILYRDEALLAYLPGSSTAFVDRYADRGEHVYDIRGRIGASRSIRSPTVRTSCAIDHDEPGPRVLFRRGDSNGDGIVDIADPIHLLGFLFLGSKAPGCKDAADADDNAVLEITDAIRTLGFLFLGGAPPASPGARGCGEDPTPDSLGCASYTACP